MKIEVTTRFNVGETVYRFDAAKMKLTEFTIKSVSATLIDQSGRAGITYLDVNYKGEDESRLYKSKDDFINQL